jgi:hypothetical protein
MAQSPAISMDDRPEIYLVLHELGLVAARWKKVTDSDDVYDTSMMVVRTPFALVVIGLIIPGPRVDTTVSVPTCSRSNLFHYFRATGGY